MQTLQQTPQKNLEWLTEYLDDSQIIDKKISASELTKVEELIEGIEYELMRLDSNVEKKTYYQNLIEYFHNNLEEIEKVLAQAAHLDKKSAEKLLHEVTNRAEYLRQKVFIMNNFFKVSRPSY